MTPLKVLLVEDSDSDAGLVLRALRRGGFDASYERVEIGADMAKALESDGWDIVISDYNLPEFDAPGALAVLKASKRDLPFIVVSGNIGEDSAVSLMKYGAHDYVLKDSLSRLPLVVQRELAEAETRRQLKQSEGHLRLAAKVFESSREAIVITDAQRRIVSANRAFSEITGHKLEDIRDQSIAVLNASSEDKDLLRSIWSQVAEHGFWQGEVKTKRKLGIDYPIRLSVTSVKDESGAPQNYVLVATDITEHKQAHQLSCSLRRVDGFAESRLDARPRCANSGAGKKCRDPRFNIVCRSRSLQGDQRFPRPPRRRCGVEGRRQASQGVHACQRRGVALGWR
jgi:PAS domain S-box-containing protein